MFIYIIIQVWVSENPLGPWKSMENDINPLKEGKRIIQA